jgi:hypothetical protein
VLGDVFSLMQKITRLNFSRCFRATSKAILALILRGRKAKIRNKVLRSKNYSHYSYILCSYKR